MANERKGERKLVNHLDILTSFLSRTEVFLPVFPIQNCPPILIQLDGSDNDLAGVDANGSGSAIRLVTLHTVNVDDPFLTVHLGDFPFPTLVRPPNNSDLIIFTDW